MKVPFHIKKVKGFSTLELMIALAILSLVMGGVVLANYNSGYWSIASQTHNEALYKAKTMLEDLRATSRGDFYSATSSALSVDMDAACAGGGLCYFTSSVVTDLSMCSKYAKANVFWQVPNYPTTTVSLYTNLTNTTEAISLGGDCFLNTPAGEWQNMVSGGVPTSLSSISGLDTLDGTLYVSSLASPYLQLVQDSFVSSCTNCAGPYNAIDAANDQTNGRTYVYAAASTTQTQLQIIDVTDKNNPAVVGSTTLATITGAAPGWRIASYGRYVLLTARYISNSPTQDFEFHIFDVSNPSAPAEVGKAKLNTSVYAILVHDQEVSGMMRRFVYLGTTGAQELRIFEIGTSTPVSVSEVPCVACDLPGGQTLKSLTLLGNTLYAGRESTPGGSDLYAFDVTNPATVSILGQTDLGTGRGVVALRASGRLLFVGTQNTVGTGGQVELWDSNPSTFSLGAQKVVALPTLVEGGFDLDEALYVAGTGVVQKIQSQ